MNYHKYPFNLFNPENCNADMKEMLQQLAAYNSWANQKVIDVILSLPEEKQIAEVPSSFRSLNKTLLHIWDAESIWWQRLKQHETIVRPSTDFKGTTADITHELINQNRVWQDWLNKISDAMLKEEFEYRNNNGEKFVLQVGQLPLHLFNHATYHRGQLINMLRQLEVTDKLPQTDFAFWTRSV